MKLTLGKIADWIHSEGEVDTDAEALGYSIDSRTIGAGDLFFAVRGERVDGHDFVEAALAAGAVAAVVSMRWLKPALVEEARLLRVPESAAVGELPHARARAWWSRGIDRPASARPR